MQTLPDVIEKPIRLSHRARIEAQKISARSRIADSVKEFYYRQPLPRPLSYHPLWLRILAHAFRQNVYLLQAYDGDTIKGLLPLAFVRSWLFGKYLVSLPYLNYGGVVSGDPLVANELIDRAAAMADELDVRYLELRHESAADHQKLNCRRSDKVHMRLNLPASTEELWQRLSSKVRNQIRKGQKSELSVQWGGKELLSDFYNVFARNMRDLGTPVFPRKLFLAILDEFPNDAEICTVRLEKKTVAAAVLLHGEGITEVPSASSLRKYNGTCSNMLMYWHLLERAIQRRQQTFDFGRSSLDSNTFKYKKQWGAEPYPAEWQGYVRYGDPAEANRENPRYHRLIRTWQRLPVWLTRCIGPAIVRGIP